MVSTLSELFAQKIEQPIGQGLFGANYRKAGAEPPTHQAMIVGAISVLLAIGLAFFLVWAFCKIAKFK